MKSPKMKISFKTIKPDINFLSFQELVIKFGLLDSLYFSVQTTNMPVVLISRYSKKKIYSHLVQKRVELGGFLIGKIYEINIFNQISYVTEITNSIESKDFKSNTVSLSLGTDIWNSARRFTEKGLLIVGWYHSHPGFGAFFSSTDRKTQQNFFQENFQIGLVVDPFSKEERMFFGKNSIELKNPIIY